MKLKAILLGCLVGLTGSSFAATYTHPEVKGAKNAVKNEKFIPGCQITLINESSYYADLYGTLDDGGTVSFRSAPYTGFDTIEMYYYDPYAGYYYCHNGMNINVYSAGRLIYGQYTPTNKVIRVQDNWLKQAKVNVTSK